MAASVTVSQRHPSQHHVVCIAKVERDVLDCKAKIPSLIQKRELSLLITWRRFLYVEGLSVIASLLKYLSRRKDVALHLASKSQASSFAAEIQKYNLRCAGLVGI